VRAAAFSGCGAVSAGSRRASPRPHEHSRRRRTFVTRYIKKRAREGTGISRGMIGVLFRRYATNAGLAAELRHEQASLGVGGQDDAPGSEYAPPNQPYPRCGSLESLP
ncbi:MAG TPA: hypothetical protein VIX14_16995, partial [Terriglobales bacterium]